MALVRCILGKFLGVACHCFPSLFRCSHFSPPGASTSATTWEFPAAEVGNFAEMTTSTPFRDLLHVANLRHRTDGFTSPPKEGVLRIFSAGFEPANLGTKGQHSTPRPSKPLAEEYRGWITAECQGDYLDIKGVSWRGDGEDCVNVEFYNLYSLGQRFSNCGPRTTSGPRVLPLWSF